MLEHGFRQMLDNVAMVAVALDEEGRVTFANDFLLELTGWSRDEVLGADWFAVFIPDDDEWTRQVFDSRLAVGDIPAHYENEIVTRHGDRRLLAFSNVVQFDEQGKPTGVISLGEDITEQRRLREQLLQAQKLEAVGRLAGGIAHDFNNVLTAIVGYSESLAGSFDEGDPRRSEALEIVRAAGRAAGLTSQLLTFSPRHVTEAKVVDLGEIVVAVEGMLTQLLGDEVTLRTTVEPGCWISANRGQLERVITNLAMNASDAMPDGGRVELTVSRQGEEVELTVADSGVGMDEENLSHIFEPFFTTKEVDKGTGLGLATVYGIVTQAGGRATVTSKPGEGATFRVILPLVQEGATGTAPDDEAEALDGTETILVAEDEDVIRELVSDILTRRGYTVLAAATGPEALQLLDSGGTEVDLLFTDILMPGMTGTELCRAATALNPSLRVLFTSGYTNEPHEIFDEPGAAFIGKPFSAQALVAKVRQVLDR